MTDCMHCAGFSLKEQFSMKMVYICYSSALLLKMLHNIFGCNTDYVILSGVLFFAACLPATVLHDLLYLQVSDIMWSSETVPPRCSHKICSCTHVVGKYSVHHMPQTRTYCKKKICTQLTRLVKLDLSVKD